MPNYVIHHFPSKSVMGSSLNNSLLLNRTNWTQCRKVLNAGIHLLGHNLYHLHLCDDYTFPSKLLIKVLSNAEPRIASYATSVQNLQHSSASTSKTVISNLECAKPTDGPHAPSKEQPDTITALSCCFILESGRDCLRRKNLLPCLGSFSHSEGRGCCVVVV